MHHFLLFFIFFLICTSHAAEPVKEQEAKIVKKIKTRTLQGHEKQILVPITRNLGKKHWYDFLSCDVSSYECLSARHSLPDIVERYPVVRKKHLNSHGVLSLGIALGEDKWGIKRLIDKGVPANQTDRHHCTALVNLLLMNRTRSDFKERWYPIAKILLDNTDTITRKSGDDPLLATSFEPCCLDIIHCLLDRKEYKAGINEKLEGYKHPRDIYITTQLPCVAGSTYLEVALILENKRWYTQEEAEVHKNIIGKILAMGAHVGAPELTWAVKSPYDFSAFLRNSSPEVVKQVCNDRALQQEYPQRIESLRTAVAILDVEHALKDIDLRH